MGVDFGKDRSGLRILLSDVLQSQEERKLVDDIAWAINDYKLSYSHLFCLTGSVQDQPILMVVNQDGTFPSNFQWV